MWIKVQSGAGLTVSIKFKYAKGKVYATATLNDAVRAQVNAQCAGYTRLELFVDTSRNMLGFRPIIEEHSHHLTSKFFSVTHACRLLGWSKSTKRLTCTYDENDDLFIIKGNMPNE
jgi:hypothetical protein